MIWRDAVHHVLYFENLDVQQNHCGRLPWVNHAHDNYEFTRGRDDIQQYTHYQRWNNARRLRQRARDAEDKEEKRERMHYIRIIHTHVYVCVRRNTKLIARAGTATHFDEDATNVVLYISLQNIIYAGAYTTWKEKLLNLLTLLNLYNNTAFPQVQYIYLPYTFGSVNDIRKKNSQFHADDSLSFADNYRERAIVNYVTAIH